MTKLSFGFIVGGGDSYYKNLMRACESLERIKQDHHLPNRMYFLLTHQLNLVSIQNN